MFKSYNTAVTAKLTSQNRIYTNLYFSYLEESEPYSHHHAFKFGTGMTSITTC